MAELVPVRRLTGQEGRKLPQVVRRGGACSVRYRRAVMLPASAGENRGPVTAKLVRADEATVHDVTHRFHRIAVACLDPRWAGWPSPSSAGPSPAGPSVNSPLTCGNFPDRVFAFDEFGPLGIRLTGGSCWAEKGRPERHPATRRRLIWCCVGWREWRVSRSAQRLADELIAVGRQRRRSTCWASPQRQAGVYSSSGAHSSRYPGRSAYAVAARTRTVQSLRRASLSPWPA